MADKGRQRQMAKLVRPTHVVHLSAGSHSLSRRYRLAPDFALGFRNYTEHGVADSLPATCWRATAWINTQERLVVTGWTRYMDTPEETAPTNIDKARGQLPAEAQWAVEWLEQIGHLDYF
jgi:hypothetical protein